jgi:hypothetical protein
MKDTYTGVGSRKTPPAVLEQMTKIAMFLAELGYTLRSGGAEGADKAFERGARVKQIFTPKGDIPGWAFVEIRKHIPPGRDFDRFRPYVQRLLARNMMQVLGWKGDEPSDFLVCWTMAGKDDGGTGYAVRCAHAHGVPVYNLRNVDEELKFKVMCKTLREGGA